MDAQALRSVSYAVDPPAASAKHVLDVRALHVVDDIVRTPAGKIDYGWAREVATR